MSVLDSWRNRYKEHKHPHESDPDVEQLNFLAASVYIAEQDLAHEPTFEKAELVLIKAEEFAVLHEKCRTPGRIFWAIRINNPHLLERINLWTRQVYDIRTNVANHLLLVQESQLTSQGVQRVEIERTGIEFMARMTPISGNFFSRRPRNRLSEIITEDGWKMFEENIAANGTLSLEVWLNYREGRVNRNALRNERD